MGLKETINESLKEAMKSKNEGALRAYRAIKAAILLVETSEGRTPGPLTADEEMKLLLKQAKQRKESIDQFRTNGRDDLAVSEEEELTVIEAMLPKSLTPEELEAELKTIIAETGASGAKDLGKVMGVANKKLAGRADGKAISEIVKRLLA